jgi:hypothetical protein
VRRLRDFFARNAICCWLCGAFLVLAAAGFSHDMFNARGGKALEASKQHRVQSVAAPRGNRVKGKKRKHGRLLSASWRGGFVSRPNVRQIERVP